MRAYVLGLLGVLIGPAGTLAQSSPANASNQSAVSISVFVTDGHGNPVNSITDTDLSIEDEHQPPRSILRLRHDTSPLRLGVLIDKSNSQRSSDLYKAGVQELGTFLKQTLQREADKVFIETFDNEPDRPMPWMNGNELGRTKLNLQPGGGTSLFDAIDLACKERFTDNNSPARRVLILLTDGDDNASRISIDAAISAAQRARAAIFAVSTREAEENIYHQGHVDGVLKKLAENTGGYAFLELSPKEIQKAFSKIGAQLDGMFEVDFVPTQAAKSGEPHLLQVKPGPGKKLRVQASKRYYAMP